MESLTLLNIIIPCVTLLAALLLRKHPAKRMAPRSGYGYNTPLARSTPERWAYAQEIAPPVFFHGGMGLLGAELALSALLLSWDVTAWVVVLVGTLVGFFLLGLCFANVDKKIRKKFP